MIRILLILTFFLLGCGTASKVTSPNFLAEKNKDVLILSSLIRDHLKQTNGADFRLDELITNDTLKRISNNFESAELKNRGGYISVYFKFSKSRRASIELTDKEKEMLKWIRWTDVNLSGQYDGEIRFEYGERFYHIKKISMKRD